jgi:plasmid stability protein
MPTLQIRNLEDDIYRRLKELAEREHRSLAQQAALTLKQALSEGDDGRHRRRAILERVRRESPWPSELPEPAELISQDRRR